MRDLLWPTDQEVIDAIRSVPAHYAGYSVIASKSAGSANGNSVNSGNVDMTQGGGADLFVAAVASLNATGTVAVTDSLANVWHPLSFYGFGGGAAIQFFWSNTGNVGVSQSFLATLTGSFPSIAVIGLKGSAASPLDQQNGAASNTTGGRQPGSITPTVGQNNEIVLTSICFENGFPITCAGYMVQEQVNFSGGNHFGLALAYKIKVDGTAENPTWLDPSGTDSEAAIVSFKAAAGGGGTGLLSRRRRVA